MKNCYKLLQKEAEYNLLLDMYGAVSQWYESLSPNTKSLIKGGANILFGTTSAIGAGAFLVGSSPTGVGAVAGAGWFMTALGQINVGFVQVMEGLVSQEPKITESSTLPGMVLELSLKKGGKDELLPFVPLVDFGLGALPVAYTQGLKAVFLPKLSKKPTDLIETAEKIINVFQISGSFSELFNYYILYKLQSSLPSDSTPTTQNDTSSSNSPENNINEQY